jgi:hypothetical protein
MFSPERLNVLLSRARNALIMIGNLSNFMHARKGRELWTKLFSLLSAGKHIYEGLPIKCERHPDRRAIVCNPDEFDRICPDGGCMEPWYVHLLSDTRIPTTGIFAVIPSSAVGVISARPYATRLPIIPK